jgi:hypothetical protein
MSNGQTAKRGGRIRGQGIAGPMAFSPDQTINSVTSPWRLQ